MLNNLAEVNEQVIPLFQETAYELIQQTGGDPEKALCIALAYISGHYKQVIAARSLITGQEGMITIKMESKTTQRMFKKDVFGILRRFWSPQSDSV